MRLSAFRVQYKTVIPAFRFGEIIANRHDVGEKDSGDRLCCVRLVFVLEDAQHFSVQLEITTAPFLQNSTLLLHEAFFQNLGFVRHFSNAVRYLQAKFSFTDLVIQLVPFETITVSWQSLKSFHAVPSRPATTSNVNNLSLSVDIRYFSDKDRTGMHEYINY